MATSLNMMDNRMINNCTVSGIGTQTPVGDGSGRVGSPRRSASDCSAISTESQVEICGNATGESLHEYKPSTENEMLLWKAWRRAEDRIRILEIAIENIQKEGNSKQKYETDEEELEREIGWSKSRVGRKKRKANSSPEISPKQTEETNNNGNERKSNPPPIFVNEVSNFNKFKEIVLQEVKNSINFKMLGNNEVKINTTNSDDFRAIIQLFKVAGKQENHYLHKIAYHTYQCKQAKPYKIVIRGLHPSTNTTDIKEELAKAGHEATRITNVIIKKNNNGKQTKLALPLFYVDLITKPNNKDAYELTELLYCKIKIEPPRVKREIPQCKRCQGFGHTQNYCQRQARCVKCGDNHHTVSCKKLKKTACKCVNCGGEHTANWKGCPVYKSKMATIHKFNMTVTQRVQHKVRTSSSYITPTKSFAEAARERPTKTSNYTENQSKSVEPTIYDVWELLKNMQEKLNNNERKMEMLENNKIYKPQTDRKGKTK